METKQVIGGEFEIDNINNLGSDLELQKEFSHGHFYSSGRAALYHIINFSKQVGKSKILLPDYLCESIIEIVKLAAIPYKFYSVNQILSIDLNSLIEIYDDNCSILVINYFGGIDIINEIKKIRSIDDKAYIILDNVQALFSMFETIDVDFMFTSFRKQLPVPDGAWVVTKHDGLFECDEKNTFAQYKLVGGLLKNFCKFNTVSDQIYLNFFENGESLINQNLNAKISDITLELLSKIDLNFIRLIRVNNSKYLIKGLQRLGYKTILHFKNNMVPLFVPIHLKNRDFFRQELRKNNIYCPVHWPKSKEIQTDNNIFHQTELSLVIDQRYDQIDMNKILSVLETIKNNENSYN